jgi:hypothetical protein
VIAKLNSHINYYWDFSLINIKIDGILKMVCYFFKFDFEMNRDRLEKFQDVSFSMNENVSMKDKNNSLPN